MKHKTNIKIKKTENCPQNWYEIHEKGGNEMQIKYILTMTTILWMSICMFGRLLDDTILGGGMLCSLLRIAVRRKSPTQTIRTWIFSMMFILYPPKNTHTHTYCTCGDGTQKENRKCKQINGTRVESVRQQEKVFQREKKMHYNDSWNNKVKIESMEWIVFIQMHRHLVVGSANIGVWA